MIHDITVVFHMDDFILCWGSSLPSVFTSCNMLSFQQLFLSIFWEQRLLFFWSVTTSTIFKNSGPLSVSLLWSQRWPIWILSWKFIQRCEEGPLLSLWWISYLPSSPFFCRCHGRETFSTQWEEWRPAQRNLTQILIFSDSDDGRDWGQEEKGTTEDEMAGWHHWLDGREFEWTPGVGEGQGGLACCDSWGRKESDTTEWLIWSDLMSFTVMWSSQTPVYFRAFCEMTPEQI